MSIISSLLDQDLYKLTIHQAFCHQFPEAHASYKFQCRNHDVDLRPYLNKIKEEIYSLENLKFTENELSYLHTLRFLKPHYVESLRNFRLDPYRYLVIKESDKEECGIEIRVEPEAPVSQVMFFEIFILSIVNEVYFNSCSDSEKLLRIGTGEIVLKEKIEELDYELLCNSAFRKFNFTDFGTRRRFSKQWQDYVISKLKDKPYFAGTSNLSLAKKYNLKAIGTVAHEWFQAGQAMEVRLINSQKFMLEAWAKEYRGDLGTALTDTIGIDAFLKDFDLYFSKLFDGVRQDSGDAFDFAEKVIKHYENFKIDPMTKHIIFSDALTVRKAISLYNAFYQRIKVGFGIGTSLTNDMGVTPLNIVFKMISCNNQPVAKISDSPTKGMCENSAYVEYLKSVFGVK